MLGNATQTPVYYIQYYPQIRVGIEHLVCTRATEIGWIPRRRSQGLPYYYSSRDARSPGLKEHARLARSSTATKLTNDVVLIGNSDTTRTLFLFFLKDMHMTMQSFVVGEASDVTRMCMVGKSTWWSVNALTILIRTGGAFDSSQWQ